MTVKINACIAEPRVSFSISNAQLRSPQIVRGPGESSTINLPPIYPEWLGDQTFSQTHGSRFNYVVGEMARGIATPEMVIAAVRSGCVGFYGSGGLSVQDIEAGLDKIQGALTADQTAWGCNLIHSPQQPGYEAAVVDLFISRGVRRVSASAYMTLRPEIVRYAASGLTLGADGSVQRKHHVFAKVSRAEVAEMFMAPPPAKMLAELVASGGISAAEADLASKVSVAADITAESDSGGHTDNRAAAPLFSSICMARERVSARTGLDANQIRIGLAGGIATPHGVAAAFQMGAAYVLTGSINQAAIESGLAPAGKTLLCSAAPSDVIMAPAADMFEQGVQVQVLRRGTLFGMRAKRLYALYREGASFETLSPKDRDWVETVLGEPFERVWDKTKAYIERTNPAEAARAVKDGNRRFALVARRYLFMGAQWARDGDPARVRDYQIWCGPAMGAFNEWVAGTFLETAERRTVRQIALNLMEGAARITRAGQLRASGICVPPSAFSYTPVCFAEDAS